jgi:hypothetical protein
MEGKNIIGCFICIVFLGLPAITSIYGAGRLTTLKNYHDTVSGTIDKIESRVSGKIVSYRLICSFTYKDQYYNIELSVMDIFPFVGAVYKEYPAGETTFWVNYEYGIAFPENRINTELWRRLIHAVVLITILFFSIKIFLKGTNDKDYKRTNQSASFDLSQVTPLGQPIPNNKTSEVNAQSENAKKENITDDKKNEEIERLEKLFDSSTDEYEKGVIAKKLYDLGKMYYWRFLPRDNKIAEDFDRLKNSKFS